VSGRAQSEGVPLRAPFSGLPCVLYSYTVEQRRQSGKENTWETIAKGTSAEPFYVQDETGRVLVVPFGALMDGNYTAVKMTETLWPPKPRLLFITARTFASRAEFGT